MKQVESVVEALLESKARGRGMVGFLRCQSSETLEAAIGALREATEWRWHLVDATEFEDAQQLLTRVAALSVDPEDVWLAHGMPDSRGPKGNPAFYEAAKDGMNAIAVVGGPKVLFLCGVPQLRSFDKLTPELWRRKRVFVAWPLPEPAPRDEPVAQEDRKPSVPRTQDQIFQHQPSDPNRVIQLITESLASAERPAEQARLYNRLALVLASQMRLEESRVAATKSARTYKEIGDVRGLGSCYELLASLAERRGNLDVARDWMQFALDTWLSIGDESRTSECHAKLGHLSYVMGDREVAAQQFQLAIEIDEAMENPAKVAAGLRRLGLMAEEEEKYKLAQKLYADAAALVEAAEDRVGLSRCYHALGRLHERMGVYGEAFEYHRKSLEIKEELGDRLGIATSYHHLANTYFFSREFDQARDLYLRALAIEDEVGDHQGRATTMQQLGETCMAQHRWGDALWYFMAAHYLWKLMGSPRQAVVMHHIVSTAEMLDAEVVDEIKADVQEKMSAYHVE